MSLVDKFGEVCITNCSHTGIVCLLQKIDLYLDGNQGHRNPTIRKNVRAVKKLKKVVLEILQQI